MRWARAGVLSIAVASTWLVLVTSAVAETRYASPGGTGTDCTSASPCSLKTAINPGTSGASGTASDIADGDTVVMLAGEYVPTLADMTYVIDHEITLRGEAGQPRPRLTSDTGTFFVPSPLIEVTAPGATIEGVRLKVSGLRGPALKVANSATASIVRNVHIEGLEHNSSGPLAVLEGACILERSELVRFDTTAPGLDGRVAEATGDVLIRDSVLRNTSTQGAIRLFGPTTAGAKLRNVTVAAGGTAIQGVTAPLQLSIRNSLIDGTSNDFFLTGGGVEFTVTHSNYDPNQVNATVGATFIQAPPNQDQTATGFFPLLVDPPNGNFRQQSGSPTRNAGSPDAFTGDFDIDGQPRIMGSAIDIGADEFFEVPVEPGGPTEPSNPGGSKGEKAGDQNEQEPGTSVGSPGTRLRIVRVRRNARRGTAFLVVRVSGPGDIVLRGRGIRPIRPHRGANASRLISRARVRLKIVPSRTKVGRKLRRALLTRGKATRLIRVAFKPVNGKRIVRQRRVTLVKR